MDVHKPKPWHGVREFLKEFGTIVLGVLVALGAEQAVEALHRQAEVREAREVLRAEIANDMMWARMNQRREVCDRRFLRKFVAWAEGGPPPPLGNTNLLVLYSTNWDVVKAGPVTAMPLKEKLAYARFYADAANYNNMADRERTAGLRIGEHYGLKKLTPQDAASLSRAIADFGDIESVMADMADGIQQGGAAMGVKATPMPPKAAAVFDAFCRAAGAN